MRAPGRLRAPSKLALLVAVGLLGLLGRVAGAAGQGPTPLPPCRVDTSEVPPQEADCSYEPPPVATGACAGGSPGSVVLVDAAHRNIFTVALRYWPFARLLTAAGCEVRDATGPLDELLAATAAKVLVIAGADDAPGPAEIDAAVAWVTSGGGLLLVLDHFPHQTAIELLRGFLPEVEWRDPTHGGLAPGAGESAPSTLFRPPGSVRLDEYEAVLNPLSPLAGNDPGQSPGDDVARVETYGGVALLPCASFRPDDPESCAPRPPEWSPLHALDPLLVFPEGARTPDGQEISGYLQAFAFRYGAGRVVATGDGAMFTAQRQFYPGLPTPGYGVWGLQESDNDNQRLLLNVVRWLAGRSDAGWTAGDGRTGGGGWAGSDAAS